MTTKKRKRKKRRDSLVLNLLIIVVVVLVLFEGRLIVTLFTHRSDVASSTVSDGTVSSESKETLSESSSSASSDASSGSSGSSSPVTALAGLPVYRRYAPGEFVGNRRFGSDRRYGFRSQQPGYCPGKLPRRWMILISPTQYLSGIPEWKASGTLPELPRVSFSPV